VFSQPDYLVLQRQPSRLLGALVILLSVLACIAVLRSGLQPLLATASMLVVVGYGVWVWPRQVSLRHAESVTGLRFDSQGWHVMRSDGSEHAVRLLADTFVSAFLTVVRLREPGRWWPVSVILLTDAATDDALRRLRLRLRFSRQRWVATE
jgi:toxin CptA